MSPPFSFDKKKTREAFPYSIIVSVAPSDLSACPIFRRLGYHLHCNNRLEFKRNLGNEQPLNGLLQVYKDYYPDVIVGDIAPTKLGLFSVSHV